MAYDDMYKELTDGVLLSKDHIVDALLVLTITKAYDSGNSFSLFTSSNNNDCVIAAGSEVLLQTNATAGGTQLQVLEIGYDTDANVFLDVAGGAANGVLLRALKWDESGSKWYVQNPTGADADGNKGWAEVTEVAVIVAGPVVMKGITTTSTWSAALIGGVSTA